MQNIICFNDAGRSESNHKDEKLDCVVRATALYLGISYDDAWDRCLKYRKPRRKTYRTHEYFLSQGLLPWKKKWVDVIKEKEACIVHKKGHVFYFDGEHVHDTVKLPKRVHVKQVWKLSQKDKLLQENP